ncbi:MAG: response regulator transcription factor [Acidimicrobiales bacterium]
MGAAAATRSRVRGDIVRIIHRGLGLPDLARTIGRSLNTAVPFEGTCLLTVDPATLLPTGEIVENGLPPTARGRLTEIELGEPDFNKFTTLARAAVPAASLSAATSGDLDRSLRQREIRRPSGFADELRTVLADATGSWATLTLLRETRRPNFTPTDVRFVASLTPILAEGVRRATLAGDAGDAGDGDRSDTGFLVLGADDAVELTNPAAEQWIDELSPLGPPTEALPAAIRAVVAQARRIAAGDRNVLASARVRTRAGRWLVVRGSPAGPDQVAVLLEAARPAELAAAIADAYGFTERERTITALVARGLPTTEIAHRLHLSAYTVQDHLKAIFDKSGTSSRGELVSRLFFDHHVDRLGGGAEAPVTAERTLAGADRGDRCRRRARLCGMPSP